MTVEIASRHRPKLVFEMLAVPVKPIMFHFSERSEGIGGLCDGAKSETVNMSHGFLK